MPVSAARAAAFRILGQVEKGGYASDLLRAAKLDTRDAGLAETIVFGTLRFRGQLDFLITHYSGRLTKLDPEVRTALRMGIYQLRYLDRIPAHAAVGESVELVKQAEKRSATGFVNAILRKVNRNPVAWPDLATELSMPAWLLEGWIRQFGLETATKAARAALEEPELAIHPDTGRQQDIGAQSIVPLLQVEAGMHVLDLCAAPGNKTAQLLAAGARVTACDRYARRLEAVPKEAARVLLDATQPLPFGRIFDRILIDAPCSGTGTLARNPEIKWRLAPQDLPRFEQTQKAILNQAMDHLVPGGRALYSTCSLEPQENDEVVSVYTLISNSLRIPGRDPGDGFFAALLTT